MLERGFKARSERTAESYRRELRLEPFAALDPRKLAAHLRVHVLGIENLTELPKGSLIHLTGEGSSEWSALTLQREDQHLIVVNTQHTPARQNSDISHELSHLICDHKPTRVDVTNDGFALLQNYDDDQEEEADWMGGTILVPRAGLLHMGASAASVPAMMEYFGVSREMVLWRQRMTGVERQIRGRARAV